MTTQITLTEAENQIIASLSENRGVTPEAILHEAIEQFLAAHKTRKPKRQFGSARGLISMAPDFDAPLDDFQEYAE